MNNKIIRKIEMTIELSFDDQKITNLVFNALLLESGYNPNERAQVNLENKGKSILLTINANDTTSARAAINSFLKWINLSIELISLTENKNITFDTEVM
ncbi:MAG: KEOPS complex subunit Pcc1 [Candidatus Thorarchaeota archaeon]